MRDRLRRGYEQFMRTVGLIAVVIGFGLLAVSFYLHWSYLPFHQPSAVPDANRLAIFKVDVARWLAISIAGSICGTRQAPHRPRSRYERGPGAQVAYPLGVLFGVVAMGAAATYCWFLWTDRLPGGDRLQNALLCGGYFAIPAALLLTFGAYLVSPPSD